MIVSDIVVEYLGGYGSDLTVANAARVSFNKESEWEIFSPEGIEPVWPGDPMDVRLKQSDAKLITYLAKHKHFSPFNHSFLSFHIKAPIFTARQLQKHKFMPWNEVSRRYVDDEPEFYIPELRKRSENVKQGSSSEVYLEGEGYNLCMHAEEVQESCLRLYKTMLEEGIAPEVARAFLPQNMMTEWIWSGTLGAFLDMLVLRLDPHTQKESRDVAEMIAMHVQRQFPVSFKARIISE